MTEFKIYVPADLADDETFVAALCQLFYNKGWDPYTWGEHDGKCVELWFCTTVGAREPGQKRPSLEWFLDHLDE